ncbi:NAD(P)-dependent dehydrogenase (short-subunit alcohol dehydrogenase family) [Tamaricihabitans halophyticus]|uniref:NAD(P)-dependent dehydrogenase (Short-subunit alcohol dehydrogenase family) n=1 Tax=Tamaricihabitans halophyticus TaxID=1262583 RepID=A0A4R2QGY1_9PSEU|nr:SDR family oxidoreductase [Tamaricihabitans halophyticus]TCP48493.1 NAD(P)-dependent dehydrogenase (short-subunit alcohol dehydrogenase family) [Tamaricihabitans halophyticus]
MTGDATDFTAELFGIAGKTAVVTGGTSGIGLMIAEGLVRAGATVLVSSRKPKACADTAELLSEFGRCTGVPADVATPAGAETLREAVDERFGGQLDILVNNAGATWGAPLEEFPDAAWDKLVNLNLSGVFRLTVALLPALRKAGSAPDPARVINIGSIAGMRVPAMQNYAYSSTKAAVHMLTRHLASELTTDHVTVNALAPGYFESRMSAFVFEDPEAKQALDASIPMGRTGAAMDIAGVVQFLSARAGAYLTGAVIPVDGGIVDCT